MSSVQAVFGLCSDSCENCPGPVPGLWGRRSSACILPPCAVQASASLVALSQSCSEHRPGPSLTLSPVGDVSSIPDLSPVLLP